MYLEQIVLTPEDILSKEFKIDTRGYRLPEVDKYLDTIMKDYEAFIRIVKKVEAEKKELIEENVNLKNEIRNLRMKIELAKQQGEKEITNLDLLRRISELEKVVYGNDD
ncbi:MAG: cell division regulator GpsB [Bacilli bacterium]